LKEFKNTKKIFFILIIVLIICQVILLFLFPNPEQISTNWLMIFVYAVLGYLAIEYFEEKAGFPEVFEDRISNKQRYLFPLIFGFIFGLVAIMFDVLNPSKVPRLPFPISVPYWIFIGISDEIFWRLFLLTFAIWLISYKILNDRKQVQVFWGVTVFEAGIYIIIQLILFETFVGPITFFVLFQILIVSGGYIIVACYCYRKGGFLSVIIIRLIQYMIYHILYGGFAYIG
jgi:hypothetical protein